MNRRGLIHWDPLRELAGMWDDDFQTSGYVPSSNIYQDNDNVVVEMEIPGVDMDKVDISVENDVLTVAGEKQDKQEIKRENYYRKEIRSGSFSRSIILPMKVQGEMASAEFSKGVLKIMLPKADEVKPKKIAVKIKE